MISLSAPVVNALQVLTVAAAAPGVSGVIARSRRGCRAGAAPGCCSPTTTWPSCSARRRCCRTRRAGSFFWLAPLAAFTCYLTVPLLIPVLTSYPLPLGYMGDILGGGFVLALGSFLVALAAADSGAPYAQMGSSRAKTFSAITEPTVLLVVFTVALITTTDLPYALAKTVRSSAGPDRAAGAPAGRRRLVHGDPGGDEPDPGRDPHRHERVRDDRRGAGVGAFRAGLRAAQVGVGDETADPLHDPRQRVPRPVGAGRPPAGRPAWGWRSWRCWARRWRSACVVAVIDNSFAKLRLFKITEFVAAAFLLAVLAVFTLYLGGG